MDFPKNFESYNNKRLKIYVSFENGVEEFYGVYKMIWNVYLNLYNSSAICHPYP